MLMYVLMYVKFKFNSYSAARLREREREREGERERKRERERENIQATPIQVPRTLLQRNVFRLASINQSINKSKNIKMIRELDSLLYIL